MSGQEETPPRVSLTTIVREWGRIGCIGFGGPPTHIKLLRELCVESRKWMDAQEFEDAIAACNLLPGPASTQLAIFCAWRLRGRAGAAVGGAAFIIPGLIVILALAALFLGTSPPLWVLGAGAGSGAAVPAVAIQAAVGLTGTSWQRRGHTARWLLYLLAGIAAAATLGPWLVLVLLGCGLIELTIALTVRRHASVELPSITTAPLLAAGALGGGVLLSVAWVAFKVGALSYGGGFVIIPLMQSDAVSHYHWMTGAQFLNAVALGQITPGPVVQTVAVVGYAAAGLTGGVLASVVAFSPSFAFVLLGAPRFDQIRGNPNARAFLNGAGPAAIGAIFGSAVPLARALTHDWQYAVLAAALILLLALRRGVVLTLVCAGAAGLIITLAMQVRLPGGLDPAAGDAGRDDADEQLPLPGGPGLDARPFGRFPLVLGHVMGWPLDQHAPPLAPGQVDLVDLESHQVVTAGDAGPQVLVQRAVLGRPEHDRLVVPLVVHRQHGRAEPALVGDPADPASCYQLQALSLAELGDRGVRHGYSFPDAA
jgi:chromate transporter